MKESDNSTLRDKLIGLGRTSMRRNYYAELLQEKQKLEEQNLQLLQEIQQRRGAEAALQTLNEELEDRIRQRTEELEQAHEYLVQTEKMAALGSLVAGISHEINTPLGISITSATYLMTQLKEMHALYAEKTLTSGKFQELSSESLESAQIMINNLIRSAELLENFKLIAIDQTRYEYRSFLVKEYTHRILTSLNPELRKKNVEVTVNCDEDLRIMGYPGVLSQILSNFVLNSLIHGFVTDGPHRITVRFRADERQLTMDYADNGCGIPADQAQRVFDPFYTTNRGTGGSGLGLFIVYNLVSTRLMGTIHLVSDSDSGAHFTLRFPLNYQAPEDIDVSAHT